MGQVLVRSDVDSLDCSPLSKARSPACLLAGLAWPERDLWSITQAGTQDAARYEAATGHRPDPRAIEMYALLWALWDIGAFLRRFSGPHGESPDSVTAWEGLVESFGDLMR